jgi:hypothetical protein
VRPNKNNAEKTAALILVNVIKYLFYPDVGKFANGCFKETLTK